MTNFQSIINKDSKDIEQKRQHRVLTSDLKKVCKTCEEAKTITQDKGRWKANVVVICPPWDAVN